MRIRQIKPEFWKDDKVGQLTAHQKLLFIGLWMLADGEGRLYNRPVIIKAELFAYDDKLTLKQVESDLVRLHDLGLILLYQVEGKQCIVINNFHKHQKLSGNENKKPYFSTIPAQVTNSSDLVATDSYVVTFSSTESVNPLIRKSVNPSLRESEEAISQFSEFWASYPKREAKQQAEATYSKHVKAGVSHESIMHALNRHVAKWAKDGTEAKFIPQPSSWLNKTPWLDEATTPPEQLIKATVATDKQAYVERVRAHMKAGGWVKVTGNGSPLNDPSSFGFRPLISYEDVTGYSADDNMLYWQWYNPMRVLEPNEEPAKEDKQCRIEPHYVDIWEGEPPCET